MRPILVLAIIILVVASAYYDLNVGTIPQASSQAETNEADDNNNSEQRKQSEDDGQVSLNYQEVIVEAGQTVYGIVRALHDDEFSLSPHKVVEDFQALNPNVTPHEIIIGHSYRFPIYSSAE